MDLPVAVRERAHAVFALAFEIDDFGDRQVILPDPRFRPGRKRLADLLESAFGLARHEVENFFDLRRIACADFRATVLVLDGFVGFRGLGLVFGRPLRLFCLFLPSGASHQCLGDRFEAHLFGKVLRRWLGLLLWRLLRSGRGGGIRGLLCILSASAHLIVAASGAHLVNRRLFGFRRSRAHAPFERAIFRDRGAAARCRRIVRKEPVEVCAQGVVLRAFGVREVGSALFFLYFL